MKQKLGIVMHVTKSIERAARNILWFIVFVVALNIILSLALIVKEWK